MRFKKSMKNVGFLLVLLLVFSACKENNQIEKEISKVDIDFEIERFDLEFANAKPEDLSQLKSDYPFLFSVRIPDSVWVERINDPLQKELSHEVEKAYANFDDVYFDGLSSNKVKEKHKVSIIDEIKRRYHANRNLCEDVINVVKVNTHPIKVCATIELDSRVDEEFVHAKVLRTIDEYFSPSLKF